VGRHRKRTPDPWYVYVVECADGTLYVGIAKDVEARIGAHNTGRGAKYTRARLPVRLLYREEHPDMPAALKREYEVKRWTRSRKIERLGLSCRRRRRRRAG
jgi:putative endonuclease